MTEDLEEFAKRLSLEMHSASPIESGCHVGVSPLRFSRVYKFLWPKSSNGTKYDKFLLIGLYDDGSFGVFEENNSLKEKATS